MSALADVAYALAIAFLCLVSHHFGLISDLKLVKNFVVVFFYRCYYKSYKRINFFDRLEEQAKLRPTEIFLRLAYTQEVQEISYRDALRNSCKWASLLSSTYGVANKDRVAIIFRNSDTFIFVYFACLALGAVPCLINHHLTKECLLHSIQICDANLIVSEDCFYENVKEISEQLSNVCCLVYENEEHLKIQDDSIFKLINRTKVQSFEDQIPSAQNGRQNTRWNDPNCLIFTSGTTGLPKAAVVSNSKLLASSIMLSGPMNLRHTSNSTKRRSSIYICIPLYHSTALLFGLGSTLNKGVTLVLSQKFSATNFWSICQKNSVSHVIYVGEMCRYLIANRPSLESRNQSKDIECFLGNGLKADVWDVLYNDFKIPHIIEFYGSTEGTSLIFNDYKGRSRDKRGAVGNFGLIGNYVVHHFSTIVEIDADTGELVRDQRGFLKRIKVGQTGELIQNVASFLTDYDGYFKNKEATSKKIIRNAFKNGDMWVRTGDIFQRDRAGAFYFSDRTGDTFRWKGENVSTEEVARIVSKIINSGECGVFGLRLPSYDGRIGCLMLPHKLKTEIDLNQLAKQVCDDLPQYAIPYFLIFTEFKYTSTHKLIKSEIQDRALKLEQYGAHEQILWLRFIDGLPTYIEFTSLDLKDIENGKVKL